MSHSGQGKGRPRRFSLLSGIALVVILAGVMIMAYPLVIGAIHAHQGEQDTRLYEDAMGGLDAQQLQDQLEEAQAYNKVIAAQHGASITSLDPSAAAGSEAASGSADGLLETPEIRQGLLDPAGNGVIGSIRIDAIGLQVPLYCEATEANMLCGAALVEGTSLPIGGPSTHAAAWAHRGEPGASYFKDLDRVAKGDVFEVSAYGQTCAYEVDRIVVVDPDDRTQLDVIEGEDIFTLVTCTPYGVNSHRLLVRGHRAG